MKTDNELIAKKRHYHRVHQWLHRNHGKATKCESEQCDGTSEGFEWALRKGCEYNKAVDNFIQLCVRCHRKYDLGDRKPWNYGIKTGPQTEVTKQRRSISLTGHRVSDETKSKISSAHKGKVLTKEHKIKLSNAKRK